MLFKILHGDDVNISTDITPFHLGWCYVTHSGDFYVDMNIGTESSPNNQRIKLNAEYADKLRYVQREEPVDAPDGTLWIDLDAEGFVDSGGTSVYVDTTLTVEGAAADAKAVGNALDAKQPKGDYSTKKYVDDSVAAIPAQVQSDWSQTDETAVDFIKNKPEIATDDEIIEMLMQEDVFPVVADADGSLLADENSNILLW